MTDRIALRALADAATPGPWEATIDEFDEDEFHVMQVKSSHTWGNILGAQVAQSDREADTDFIAAAREAMPALLDLINAVLTLHPVEEYRQYPAAGLVDDPNDPPVTGCPMCETVGECPTRRALSDDARPYESGIHGEISQADDAAPGGAG